MLASIPNHFNIINNKTNITYLNNQLSKHPTYVTVTNIIVNHISEKRET